MQITLVTINTWKCDGDYFQRRQVLATQLKALDAQVILCQECFQTDDGQVDTLDFLSKTLDMEGYYMECRQKQRLLGDTWVKSSSGLGILTRYPVLREEALDLPSDDKDGGRAAQFLTLEPSPGVSLLIANVHLTHLRDGSLLRSVQLRAVQRKAAQSPAMYRIVGGDFNTDATSEDMQDFLKQAADCYILGEGKEPRTSLVEAQRRNDSICVDYLFALPFPGTRRFPSCRRSAMVLDKPDTGTELYASDHFGVCTTIVME